MAQREMEGVRERDEEGEKGKTAISVEDCLMQGYHIRVMRHQQVDYLSINRVRKGACIQGHPIT